MSKRKRARIAKAQSSSKVRSKAARGRVCGHRQARTNSKQARVLALLRAERRHHLHCHALHRLAAAHGAGLALINFPMISRFCWGVR
jgi:hypothetical protein